MTDPKDKNRWPHIAALLDSPEGHIILGHMPPIEGAAIAVDHQALLVSLVRRPNESFPELLQRLEGHWKVSANSAAYSLRGESVQS